MKGRVCLDVLSLFLIICFTCVTVKAAVFTDDTQPEFLGTFNNTSWNNIENGIGLNATGISSGNGTYTSEVKDSGGIASWDGLSWRAKNPYWKQLPNNQQQETGYVSGNVNMTGNLALWHLEESGSLPRNDTSGNSNNATCGPICPAMATNGGIYGNSAQFNSQNTQYFNTNLANSVKGLSQVTFEAWIRPSAVGSNRTIYDESVPSSSSTNRFRVELNASRVRLSFRANDSGGATTMTGSTVLVANSYYHIMVVFDSIADQHYIYVNGVQDAINTSNQPAFPNTNPNTTPKIAQRSNGSGGKFQGHLDEVAIYNRALSAQEAANHFSRGALRLSFKARSCVDITCIGIPFIGPNGTVNTSDNFQDTSTNGVITHILNPAYFPDSQYFQYIAYLSYAPGVAVTGGLTPIIYEVSINYTLNVSAPTLSFSIRNSTDTGAINTCDFGTVQVGTLDTCSYRLKIASSGTGYTVQVRTDGGLAAPDYTIIDAAVGTGGGGGTDISSSTVGTEAYGIVINPGSLSSGGSITRSNSYNAGSTNSVRLNTLVAQNMVTASGANIPNTTDTSRTILVTHNLNIAGDTPPGLFTQQITYTILPTF